MITCQGKTGQGFPEGRPLGLDDEGELCSSGGEEQEQWEGKDKEVQEREINSWVECIISCEWCQESRA